MGNRKVLLGLTTTSGSDWREKTEEIDKFRIKEVALFPTCLDSEQRKELYSLLEKTGLEQIPHVHLRDNDMSGDELEYLIKKYNTQVFNLHPKKKAYEFLERNERFREIIYIENLYRIISSEQFGEKIFEEYGVAGICLDTAHLKSEQLLFPENYKKRVELIEKYQIGCNHISAIVEKPYIWEGSEIFDTHMLTDFSELDYLKDFPKKYFSAYVSIELENSLEEQLEAKKYIEDIINNIKE
jgi:sugar phosphate isomerase/epimerase